MDSEERAPATRNVLDPRRVGKQNSGFSDEDISDIICVLVPQSDSAGREVQRLAETGSPHVIDTHEADEVEPDYELDDHVSRFKSDPSGHGNYIIILRLSAVVKNPAQGFTFGRNHSRCDVVFVNDPLRRVSNIHFRIYINEYGAVMIEDQSTNGTFVDRQLLTARAKGDAPVVTKWVLNSGALIKLLLHHEDRDLTFRARIPWRDDDYALAYLHKVEEYFARHRLRTDSAMVPTQGLAPPIAYTGGHVDLFKRHGDPSPRRGGFESAGQSPQPSLSKHREAQNIMRREWTGSGKYNRIGTIGKGALAVVYKVTSKHDGKLYAAKELEKRRFIKNGVLDQKVENEMKIMRRVQHPNIVRYMENIEWDDRLLIIMECVPGGDLGKTISDEGPFPEDMTGTMSKQLLSALGYLHTNNIIHRDVKPDNILINTLEPLQVKLTGLELSKVVDTEQAFLRTFCGALLYCAPEVYTEYVEYDDNGVRNRGKKMRRVPGRRYNHAVDIWSLGGVLFYTMTGSPPYPVNSGISYSELLHKIMTTLLDVRPLQQHGVSGQGVDFLHQMLQRRPENRASIIDLENHVWLGGQGSTIQASQSYDEITDDEDIINEPSPFRPPMDFETGRVRDSKDNESENDDAEDPPPRLFGDVGVSAIGSFGVIPTDYINLSVGDASMGETEILDSHGDEANGSSITGLLLAKQKGENVPEVAPGGLTAGIRRLPQPLQDALGPLLEDETFRKQVDQRFGEFESNTHLLQESAVDFLDELGLLGVSLRPDQVRSQVDLAEEPQQGEWEVLTSDRSANLFEGLRSLPQPLPETLSPLLEDETFRKDVEKRFVELERSTQLRQERAADLLHALGSLEGLDSEGHDGSPTTCQGGVEVPGLRLYDGPSQDQSLARPPSLRDNQPSEEDGPILGVQSQSHSLLFTENFFDWSSLHSRTLSATEDILEKKYLAVLAIYDRVKANIGANGTSISLEGIPGLLRHYLHKDDYVALFRSGQRHIRLPIGSAEKMTQNGLENLETALFDTSKFCGFDTRLTCVTYNDGRYGTITLFTVSMDNARPIKVRPEAAMTGVPKILLEKIGDGISGSSKTKLSMPHHEIWRATEQWTVGRWKKQVLRPEFTPHQTGTLGHRIAETLRTALSMDGILFHCLNATIPQMIAMLHHKASLMENIESTPVYLNGDRDGVRMVRGPYMMGHGGGNARIIVLAPARGSWVEGKLSWT